jgi:hypothetical protein
MLPFVAASCRFLPPAARPVGVVSREFKFKDKDQAKYKVTVGKFVSYVLLRSMRLNWSVIAACCHFLPPPARPIFVSFLSLIFICIGPIFVFKWVRLSPNCCHFLPSPGHQRPDPFCVSFMSFFALVTLFEHLNQA